MGLDGGVFISIFFYVIFAGACLLPFLVRKARLRDLDPFDPYVIISLLLFLYTIATLRGFAATGLADTLEAVSSFSVMKFALACLIGQFGLALGELAVPAQPRAVSHVNNALDDYEQRLLTGPGLMLAVLLLPFYAERFDVFNVTSYADAAFESRVERILDQTMGIKDVFLVEMPVSLLLCACTVLLFDAKRLLPVRVGACAALAAYTLASLLAGWRGQLLATATLPVLYFHYRIRRMSILLAFSVAGAGYFVMSALEIARQSSDPGTMLELMVQQVGNEGYSFLEIDKFSELQTSTNLVRLIVAIDTKEDSYRYGMVAASNLLSMVPRAIWPTRPPTGAELYVQVFYPGLFETGGGHGSFILQDPYWDFGLVGVFGFAFGFAWLTRKSYVVLINRRSTSLSVLVYAVIFGTMVVPVIRSGMYAAIKTTLMGAAPLIAILILASKAAISRKAPTGSGALPASSASHLDAR